MMQEISKIVGDMWQKALPEQKAPYIEQVSILHAPDLAVRCMDLGMLN